MENDEDYQINTMAKKPTPILNLAIARESLANAKKMCEQHGHANPALVKILVGHILPHLSCILFCDKHELIGTFPTICDEFYGEKISLGIDTVRIKCANPTSMLSMIEQINFIERTYSRDVNILPSTTTETRVKLVFCTEIDLSLWDDKRLLIAARMQLLLSHMNMIIDSVEREIAK